MKVGIFGGTFDPVHVEHLNICLATKQQLGLDLILVLPSAFPPHKIGLKTESFENRLAMTKLLFENQEGFIVSDLEKTLPSPNFTYQTLNHIKSIYANAELFFIMGADSFLQFSTWKYPERILENCQLAVCLRKGYDDQQVLRQANLLKDSVILCNYTGDSISSSLLRVLLEFNYDASEMVGDAVNSYIKQNNLYSDYNELVSKFKELTSDKRFNHTMYVAAEAVKLSKRLGVDSSKAFIAATLHDCTKKLTEAEVLNRYNFTLKEHLPEPVIHAYTGAYVAEHFFNIKDVDILNSIKYHTTARPKMSILEKIIYVADCIEESRDYDGVEDLRFAVAQDFEQGFIACLKLTMEQLRAIADRQEVSDLTNKAYCYYVSNDC